MRWRLGGSHVTARLDVHVPTSVLPHLGGQSTPYNTLADSFFAHTEQVGRLPHSHPLGCQPVPPDVTPAALAAILHTSNRLQKALSLNLRATQGSVRSSTSRISAGSVIAQASTLPDPDPAAKP